MVAPTGHAPSAFLARFFLLLQAYAKPRAKALGRWTLSAYSAHPGLVRE